ncbi:3-dehydroquinate synthase [hydrothermal vent metagenome]|uniref:3-dehydroquinate synthase n=1 Tax=hydrothermal vent metagenome TaxID=652676 RepID=A0A3B1A586_9ZZZZ
MMKTLNVDLGDRSYPIYIGQNLISQAALLAKHIHGKQVLVVSNETVAPLYLKQTLDALQDFDCQSVILPDGEQYKTLEVLNLIYDKLLEKRFDRQCTLIALGGGVIGDMTGYAAASYQRGVNFIQIPTTLLAQVDSSVGGKTGVNHRLGKNMIGAFYQPQCVLADTDTLNTLDDRQLSAGIAEVIKYGLVRDAEFFNWLEQNIPKLLQRDSQALTYAIDISCKTKANVVSEDEHESGVRAILNLGHTFGHAIETGMGYGNWLHGEAVAAGMVMATDLSCRMKLITSAELERIKKLILMANLPILAPNEISVEKFLELMAVDKKVIAGQLRLVLLKSLNFAIVTNDFEHKLLLETLKQVRANAITESTQTVLIKT